MQDEGELNQQPENQEDLTEKTFQQSQGVPLPEFQAVEWSASEFIEHQKSSNWYFALFAGAGLLVLIVFFITRDYLASAVVLLACVAISVYAGRQPATKRYLINSDGVMVDQQFYPYAGFRSFSVVEDGAIDSVVLVRLKRFTPPIVMYFPPDEEDKIVDTLANFLPHEQRELDAIDRLSRRFRF